MVIDGYCGRGYSTSFVDGDTDGNSDLLCLNCRRSGHIVQDCPRDLGIYQLQTWAFSSDRKILLNALLPNLGSDMCQRCTELGFKGMFEGDMSWSNPLAAIPVSEYAESPHHRNLGPAGSVRFSTTCPLCVALFCLVPGPWSVEAHVHLITDWSVHRLERLISVDVHDPHQFDKCVIACLASEDAYLEIDEHEGDALVIMRDECGTLSFSGQRVHPTRINVDLVHHFLNLCNEQHPITCRPKVTPALQKLVLIDIETRRLVAYPFEGCQYVALSYVWGNVVQPAPTANSTLPPMPATIEDAISLTGMLGKRYIWVDSLCINQSNEREKMEQIHIMSDIYRGAFATIVSLCGSSVHDGLTRVGDLRLAQPQLSCRVGDTQVIGLMPTLSRQIAYNKWGERSWTLQEALLSHRTVYIADHQAYFECNAMQCSESVDIRNSWIHNTERSLDLIKSNVSGRALGHGTLRNTVTGIGEPSQPMMAYGTLSALYSYRSMTDQRDALNAFTAILQHLQEFVFSHGFCWGLPRDDFNWSLLWCGLNDLKRRSGFPMWSWAGWKGPIHPGWPNTEDSPTQRYWTHFYAWELNGGSLQLVFPQHTRAGSDSLFGDLFSVPTPFDICTTELQNSPGMTRRARSKLAAIRNHLGNLILDCLVMRQTFKLLKHDPELDFGPWNHFTLRMNGVTCYLRKAHAARIDRITNKKSSVSYVLTGRDKIYTRGIWWVAHHFLDVDIAKNGEATRRGVIVLMIPEMQPEALDGIAVMRRGLILI